MDVSGCTIEISDRISSGQCIFSWCVEEEATTLVEKDVPSKTLRNLVDIKGRERRVSLLLDTLHSHRNYKFASH